MTKSLICPKCKGTMIEGFVSESKDETSNSPIHWILGQPDDSSLPETDASSAKTQLPIKTFCCRKCGFLEFYAS